MKERSNHSLVWRENWPVDGMEFSGLWLLITGVHDMKAMFLQMWPGDYLYQTHLGYLLKMQISEPHPIPSELSCSGPGISIFSEFSEEAQDMNRETLGIRWLMSTCLWTWCLTHFYFLSPNLAQVWPGKTRPPGKPKLIFVPYFREDMHLLQSFLELYE